MNIKIFVQILSFVKVVLNLTKNIQKITKGPKLKNGQIKKINNSLNVTFSKKMPKK